MRRYPSRNVTKKISLHRRDSRKILRPLSSSLLREVQATISDMRSLKDIFADNLSAAMEKNKISPNRLARLAKWPRGNKAGKPISARQILNATKRGDEGNKPSVSLDFVQGICKALRIDPWEILTDSPEMRRHLLEKLLSGQAVNDDRISDDGATKGGRKK